VGDQFESKQGGLLGDQTPYLPISIIGRFMKNSVESVNDFQLMHKEKKDGEGAKKKKGNRKMQVYNDNEDVDSSSAELEE